MLTTNKRRAGILAIYHGAIAAVGLVLLLIGTPTTYALGYAGLFDGAVGLFTLSVFRGWRINPLYKLLMLAASVGLMIWLYKAFSGNEPESVYLGLLVYLTLFIGVLAIGISRLCLTKSRGFFILSLLILPISAVSAWICSLASVIVTVVGMAVFIGVLVIFVWYAGSIPSYESERYYFEYKTSDGRILHQIHDNVYTDDCGGMYEVSVDGRFVSEL